jgi:hypothetical protein
VFPVRATNRAILPVLWRDPLERSSYGDAFSSLWWFAWFRGASFLPDHLLADLEDWIHDRLLTEIDRLEQPIPGTDAVLAVYDAEMANA